MQNCAQVRGRESATLQHIVKILVLNGLCNPVLQIFEADPSKLAFLDAIVFNLIPQHFDLNGLAVTNAKNFHRTIPHGCRTVRVSDPMNMLVVFEDNVPSWTWQQDSSNCI